MAKAKEEAKAIDAATEAVVDVAVESKPKVAKAGKKSAKAISEKEAEKAKKAKKESAPEETPVIVAKQTRSKLERAGKRIQEATKLIDKDKSYSLDQAIDLAIKSSTVKFDATAEMHFNLNVDPKQADQNIRETIILPEGTGKTIRVATFTDAEQVEQAKAAGADISDPEKLMADLDKGVIEFDILIATPQTMAKLGKFARVLGPKGLMPNPKSGTVTADIAKAVKEAKAGKIEYRVDSNSIVHVGFGKISFGKDRLKLNATAVLNSVKNAKPSSVKGAYISSVYITSSMGPSIKLDSTEY